MHILLVEDEVKIATFMLNALNSLGYVGELAQTVARSLEVFQLTAVDLVILDVNLPDGNGLDLCQKMKKLKPHVPILIVSTLDQIHEKVQGLESGADDYITKPFFVEELSARIRVLLRRYQDHQIELTCGELRLDLVKHQALHNGKPLKLTSKEFALLEYLMKNLGRPVTRQQIAQNVWDLHFDPESNIIDVYIKQLRRKIDLTEGKKLIKTLVGIGYEMNND